jgi:WD40 repeat protein
MIRFIVLIIIFTTVKAFTQDEKYLVRQYKNHKGEVKSLEFSPSGKYLASGGSDKSIYIINTETGENNSVIADNYFPVFDMEFYGEDQLFVTSGNDIKLIDRNNNKQALFQGNSTYFWSIDFAPERNKITGGSYDRKIRVWDVKSQTVELTLEGHEKNILTATFSPDEKYLVSGSLDLTIKTWNAKTGELMHSLEKHSDNIYDIKFHPNSKYFASASGDKTIRLWDIETGTVIKTYVGHDESIVDIEFSPDGYFLYSASVDGTVIIWETDSGTKLYSYILHDGAVNSVAVSSDGNYAATGGKDGVVNYWESAKFIAVDFYFENELKSDIAENPVFAEKKKDETKQAYADRQKEAAIVMNELVDKYFEKYKQKVNYKNIPDKPVE